MRFVQLFSPEVAMAKKRKGTGQKAQKVAKKTVKKALRSVKQRGPFTAALVAIGGVASSVLASEKFRNAVQDFTASAMTRASRALEQVSQASSTASEAIGRLRESRDDGGRLEESRDDGDRAHA